MATNTQSEIAQLRNEISRLQKELTEQGSEVYDDVRERTNRAAQSIRPAMKSARRYLRAEGNALSDSARNHPAALSGVVVLAGLAGIAVGYLLGAAEDHHPRRRRWY